MSVTVPHYLLFTESSHHRPGRYWASASASLDAAAGHWRFVLETVDGASRIEAEDVEPQVSGERLELLAVVRGLEAIEQPARVTLLSSSRYVHHGIRFGLENWRENEWQWESYGQMLPVKHRDLWERVDRALQIHQVACRSWMVREEADEEPVACPTSAPNRVSALETSCSNPRGVSRTAAKLPSRRRVRSSQHRPPRRVTTSSHPAERWWHQVVRLFGGERPHSTAVRLGA